MSDVVTTSGSPSERGVARVDRQPWYRPQVLVAAAAPVVFFVTGLVTYLAHGTGDDENTQTFVLVAIGCAVYGAGSLARQTRGPGWFDAAIGTGLGAAGIALVTARLIPDHERVLLVWKLLGLLVPVAVAAVVGGLWPGLVTTAVGFFCIEYYLLGTYREFAIGARGILYGLLAVAVVCALARRWPPPVRPARGSPLPARDELLPRQAAVSLSATTPMVIGDRLVLPYRTRLRWATASGAAGMVLVLVGVMLGIVAGAVGELAGTTVGWVLGGAAVVVTSYAAAWAFDEALFEGRLSIDQDGVVVRDVRGRSVAMSREDVTGFAARDSGRGDLAVHVLLRPGPSVLGGVPHVRPPVRFAVTPRSLARGDADDAAVAAAALLNRTWSIHSPPHGDGDVIEPRAADLPVRFEEGGCVVEVHATGLILGRQSTTWWLPWQSVDRVTDSYLRQHEAEPLWALGIHVHHGPLLGVLGLPKTRSERRAALGVVTFGAGGAGVPCALTGLRRGASEGAALRSRTLTGNQLTSAGP